MCEQQQKEPLSDKFMECDSPTHHTECNDEAKVVMIILSLSDTNNAIMTSKFLSCDSWRATSRFAIWLTTACCYPTHYYDAHSLKKNDRVYR